ncbi:hypothetical protein QE152_g37120 [Popillia japonica]|uniref:Uncharacterized protein n=1 Tax=Popillia japonica TaxID=7064 RepID=A0AAW1IBL0_POPJA
MQRRLKILMAAGIKFKIEIQVGKDISAEEIEREFDAIVLCIGASLANDIHIRGRNLKGLKRILRYLCGTMNLGLFYGKTEKDILVGYGHSDWTSVISRKSTTGYLFKDFGSIVCWQTKKQSSTALSSTEAEYVAERMAEKLIKRT